MTCTEKTASYLNATAVKERGFLIPPWYQSEQPNELGLRIVWLVAGLTIPLAGFTCIKAIKHSWSSYKSKHLFNPYIIMVWAVWTTSVGISIASFLFLTGVAPPSFWTFFAILLFWLIQMQCILQIVANRVSVLMASQQEARNVKVGILLVMTFLTFSVACTWMPARLQISPYIVHVNDVWDRASKAVFLCLDLSLNLFFLKTVSRKLISAGLTKYKVLFRYNACMVCISMLIDVLPVQPLVLLWKLYIELNLAELIAKVVHASTPNEASRAFEKQWGSQMTTIISARHIPIRTGGTDDVDAEKGTVVVESSSSTGIMKTVELQVLIQKRTHEMVGDVKDGPTFM
ncbi:hypothetical protein PG988_003436 [Apiospora saccharicola]